MGNYRFILSGGGTGGHIYPAIAIADELKSRYPKAEFLFVGANDRMEMEKVPQAGYIIKGLWISGIQRKPTFKNMMFPFKVINSLVRARNIIQKFKPSVVIGTGGFASGPLLKVASSSGLPCVIQEQNSYAGITNKLLAKKAKKICVAYDDMERFFPVDKIVKTGNPVRGNLVDPQVDRKQVFDFFGLNSDQKTLLVLGGSLGARRINDLIEEKLDYLKTFGLQIIWQCGKLYHQTYKKHESKRVKVHAFLNRMEYAYAAADIIISRAGAGSVSELCIVGKPVIFIPSPNVAEDHQTKNAEALASKNAAILLKEQHLKSDFENKFSDLFLSRPDQEKMGKNIKKLALPNATEHIVDEIEKFLK